ncbi:40S ribosomal protein S5-1 [Hordeum vulgare]|nr:40S ribosomal protein S5-1 [Hordeum vulgare]
MAASSSSKDKFFDNVINPYVREVMQHPQAIQMREGVLHIRNVQGPKGMVERGLNANHLMITDDTRDLKVDGKSMKDIVFSLNEQINFLHSQIHDLQSQVFEYEARKMDAHFGFGKMDSHLCRKKCIMLDQIKVKKLGFPGREELRQIRPRKADP